MARNKLRARREEITSNISREERNWRMFDKDLDTASQKKADTESKPKAKKKSKKQSKKK